MLETKCVGDMEPYLSLERRIENYVSNVRYQSFYKASSSYSWNSQDPVKWPNSLPSRINCFEIYSTSASKKWFFAQWGYGKENNDGGLEGQK